MEQITIEDSIDGYILKEDPLGKGSTSIVYEGRNQNGRAAIKFYKQPVDIKTYQNQQEKLLKLSQLQHPNIVGFRYSKSNVAHISLLRTVYSHIIVLDVAERGQLWEYLNLGAFQTRISRAYFKMMVSAIQYMHSKQICHLELKPQNLLVAESGELKICDFGTASRTGIELTHYSSDKNQAYTAPQIHLKKYEGAQADVFSIGVLLFIMEVGKVPFQTTLDPYYKRMLLREQQFWQHSTKYLKNKSISADFKVLIKGMLAKNPNERWTLEQIKNSEWYKQDSATLEEILQQLTIRHSRITNNQINAINRLFSMAHTRDSIQICHSAKTLGIEISEIPVISKPLKGDLVVRIQPHDVFNELNSFLQDKTVKSYLAEDGIENSQLTLTQSDTIEIVFEFDRQEEEQTIQSILVIKMMFTKDRKLVLRMERTQGSMDLLLFYRMQALIRSLFTHPV